MKRKYILLSAIVIFSLLTACGNNKDTSSVQIINNMPTETESSTVVEETTISVIETQSETETTSELETETTIETETISEIETETVIQTETQAEEPETTITYKSTSLDQIMYAKQNCNVREKPSTECEIVAHLEGGKEVHVTGKVNEVNWYEIEIDSEKAYVSASLLVSELLAPSSTTQTTPSATNTETPSPSTDYSYPSVATNPPDENGEYVDEYGLTHTINPATGDYYKEGDVTSEGWIYHEYIPGL